MGDVGELGIEGSPSGNTRVGTEGISATEWVLRCFDRDGAAGLRIENPKVPNTLLLGTFRVGFSKIDGAGEDLDVCVSRGDFKLPSSSEIDELWERCDPVFPLPHNIPIQPWGAFEGWGAYEGKSTSLLGAITDEDSSPSEEESTGGEFS